MSDASSKHESVPITAPWRAWQATIATVLVFLLSQIVLILLLVLVGLELESLSTAATIGTGLATSTVTLLLAWWFASWFGSNPKKSLGLHKPTTNIWPIVGLGMLVFIIVSALSASLVERLWPSFDPAQEQDLGLGQIDTPLEYISTFILLVMVAPLVEEVVFRGILFSGWRRHGFIIGAFVSSLFFGLAHWQPNVVLATIVLGWILAYLYEKTGSLWAPIALHSAKNLLAFALVYVLEIS